MPDRNTRTGRRVFASGWVSEKDPLVMALIWQVDEMPDTAPPVFEAEVVRDLDVIDVIRAPSVDELTTMLTRKYES